MPKCDNCRERAEMELITTCCENGTCNGTTHYKLNEEDQFYRCPVCKCEIPKEEGEE